jgi:microsomal dipeptidase-like Zn-dependent dipeptidase
MPKKDYTVDIHCHTSLRALNTSSANNWENTTNPEGETAIGRWARLKTHEMTKQSQSNYNASVEGGVRVIIDALHSLEKGWYDFRLMPSLLMKKARRNEVLQVVSGITAHRLKEVIGRDNYFVELEESYKFLEYNQGVNRLNGWNYQLVENYDQLLRVLEREQTIAVLVCIEGGHCLGVSSPLMLKKSQEYLSKVVVRNIHKVKEWKYPPIYLTLNHFFWNQLAGHAKSLKPPVSLLYSQNKGMNLGITDLGWIVIEELLTRSNGKRIHIDVKHMSAVSRKQYYAYVRRNNKINVNDKIPVLSSHTGVSGLNTLDDMINYKTDSEAYFNDWSLNMCSEDLHMIHDSGGFFGLILDKAVLGHSHLLNDIKNTKDPVERKKKYIKLIWDTLFHVVEVIGKKSAWNIMVLGSDYDGMICHIEFYETISSIPDLKKSMITYLCKYQYRKDLWYGYKPESLVMKVFQTNAMRFLKTHFI